jgi:hypothetical protein
MANLPMISQSIEGMVLSPRILLRGIMPQSLLFYHPKKMGMSDKESALHQDFRKFSDHTQDGNNK